MSGTVHALWFVHSRTKQDPEQHGSLPPYQSSRWARCGPDWNIGICTITIKIATTNRSRHILGLRSLRCRSRRCKSVNTWKFYTMNIDTVFIFYYMVYIYWIQLQHIHVLLAVETMSIGCTKACALERYQMKKMV